VTQDDAEAATWFRKAADQYRLQLRLGSTLFPIEQDVCS